MQKSTSVYGLHQLESGSNVSAEPEPESVERHTPRYSITGGRKTICLRIEKIGKVEAAVGVDWCQGFVRGQIRDAEQFADDFDGLAAEAENEGVANFGFLDHPASYKPGGLSVRGYVRFPHRVELDGGRIVLAAVDPRDVPANVKNLVGLLQIKGTGCMGLSGLQVLDKIQTLADGFGLDSAEVHPTRVDFFADVFGLEIQQVVQMLESGALLSRLTKERTSREFKNATGIELGNRSGDAVFVRIYDKRAELNKTGNETKLALYKAANPNWDGGAVTRFEFECKRNYVKARYNVRRLIELRVMAPHIILDLMNGAARVVDPESATRNTRKLTSQWWKELAMGFSNEFVSAEDGVGLSPDPVFDPKTCLVSIGGMVSAIAANMFDGDIQQAERFVNAYLNAERKTLSRKAAAKSKVVWASKILQSSGK